MRSGGDERSEIGPLLVSVFFGFGINLLTAEASGWWGPLLPLSRYPYVWVPLSLLTWMVWVWWRRRWARRAVPWRGRGNPYPGLAPFTVDRAEVFFGRQPETGLLLERLDHPGSGAPHRFVPLIGPSGCGKSSLVQAGLLPSLHRRWRVIGPLRPTADPFLSLVHACADAAGRSVDRGEESRRLRSGGADVLLELVGGGTAPILLVIDQWEDLHTLVAAEEQELFLTMIRAALHACPQLHVLAAMRTEYLNAATKSTFRDLFARPVPIGPLGPDRLREAVLRPAQAAGIDFEPGLIDLMVAEATVGDAMPLLGHLLRRLYWAAGDAQLICIDDYDRAGRVSGAIAEHADAIYRGLLGVHTEPEVHRALLMFVGIEGDEPVRRTVARESLGEHDEAVVAEFREARLIVDADQGRTLELAHDALFRQWRTLADLVAADADRLRQLTLLEHRAHGWWRARAEDDLLRGRALETASKLIEDAPVSTVVTEFVEASREVQRVDLVRRADRTAAWAQQLRTRDPGLAYAVAVAAVKELSPSPAARLTLWALTAAPAIRRLPVGHTRTPAAAVWLSTDRLRTMDDAGTVCTWDSRGRLEDVRYLLEPSTAERGVSLSPDGRYALVCNVGEVGKVGTVELWRVDESKRVGYRPGWRNVNADNVSWAGDGRWAGQYDFSSVDLYALVSGRPVYLSSIESGPVTATSWSPSGTRLAVATDDAVEIFDASRPGTKVAEIELPYPSRITWSPDGRHLAVTCERLDPAERLTFDRDQVVLYDIDESDEVTERRRLRSNVLAWSPDSRFVALVVHPAAGRYAIEVRETRSDRLVRTRMHSNNVDRLVWSPDGRRLGWIASTIGDVHVWDVLPNRVRRLPAGRLLSLTWSPDRHQLALARLHTETQVIRPDGGTTVLSGEPGLGRLCWSPTGSLIARADGRTALVWRADTGRVLATLRFEANVIGGLSWSPDGRFLAGATHDFFERASSTLVVWDSTTWEPTQVLDRGTVVGGAVAWSPTGERLAAPTMDDAVTVWCARTGQVHRITDGFDRAVGPLSWSPDGRFLTIAAGENIDIHDLDGDGAPVRCVGHAVPIRAFCWSTDGLHLASADHAGALHIWDAVAGTPLAALDLRPGSTLLQLYWAAQTSELVATFDDGVMATLLIPDPAESGAIRTDTATRVLTDDERHRFGLPPADQAL